MKKVKSIGLIETLGMVGAVEAADAATKAANVELLGYELNRAGFVTVKLTGDVAAVKAAVSSGGATAQKLGNLVATHVIPRPDNQLVDVFVNSADNVPKVREDKKKPDSTAGDDSGPSKADSKPAQKGSTEKSKSQTPKGTKPAQSAKPGDAAPKTVADTKPKTPSDKPVEGPDKK